MSVRNARILALVVITALGLAASLPAPDLKAAQPERFSFGIELLDHTFASPVRHTRDVNRALEHIRPWIASVGAAAAVGDLDGNLKADDTCYVDTRTNKVVVAPLLPAVLHPELAGRQSDFEAFALAPPDRLAQEDARVAPMGCLIGDINEDGAADLIVYYWGRAPALYLRVTPASAPLNATAFRGRTLVASEAWFTNAALLADMDGDGHLDLVVGNYFCDGGRILDTTVGARPCPGRTMQDSMSRAFNGGANRILLMKPAADAVDGFPQVAETHPFDNEVAHGWTLALGAQNLLGDGETPDLYVANDFGPDRLLANCSHAVQRFGSDAERAEWSALPVSDSGRRASLQERVRQRLGCTPVKGPLSFALLEGRRGWTNARSNVLGRDSFKGMGVDFGDVDGDGLPDVYVSNITERWALQESQNLYLSKGRRLTGASLAEHVAPYVGEAERMGVSRTGWAWDAKLADFDNDGRLEALQAVGFVRGHHPGERITWRKSCWANLQELATANDRLLAGERHWFNMEHDALGQGCDLSGDSRRNPFFARPRQESVFQRVALRGDDSAMQSDARGRFENVSEALDHLRRRVAPTRGLAIGDANQDGLLDYVEAKQYAPHEFHLNTGVVRRGTFLAFTPRFVLGDDREVERGFVPREDAVRARTRAAIGAQFTVILTEPRTGRAVTLHAQVDGGNGHSGKRSHDVHIGLGQVPPDTKVVLRAEWLSPSGRQSRTFEGPMSSFSSHQFLLL